MHTVGEMLRSEREKKGFSIKDIENATSIRSLYINAIEEDNYSVIPGEVYLKGFIRNYANFLGMSGQEIVDLYRKSQTDSKVVDAEELGEEAGLAAEETTTTQSKGAMLKWVAVGVIVVCAVGGLWWSLAHRAPEQQAQQKQLTPVQPPSPQVNQPSVIANEQAVAAKGVTINAKFTDQCWTLVTADGKEIYEGTPKTGETFTWQAKQVLEIQLGNAGAVDLVYNGQPVGKVGGKGEVVAKTFSINNPKP